MPNCAPVCSTTSMSPCDPCGPCPSTSQVCFPTVPANKNDVSFDIFNFTVYN